MTTKQEQAVHILDLSTADYFSFDEDKQLKLQESLAALFEGDESPEQMRATPQPIVVLAAPKRVNLDDRSVVPLLVGLVQSGLRAWEVNYKTNLHVFVRDLTTGDLWIAQPLVDMRRGQLQLLSGVGEPPDDLNAQTLHSSVTFIDLQKKLEGRMKPGRFIVTAAAYELLSNSVEIQLENSAEPLKTAIMAMPQPYIKYVLEKSVQLETKVEIPKQASMNSKGFIDVAIQVSKDTGVHRAESGDVLWTCNLILVKLDEQPDIIPVSVPVQEVSTVDGKSAFNAVFQIDLAAITKARDAGQYQVYMDMGVEVLGPYPLTICVE